ncbi:type II toxin-antitoxin system YafQ family toxin [bacterium]|nr:type II toxin-antitoxin system YafQ family toxin [bacterium]MBP5435280.1 type II toxin-antitoxin system YafQ family toxin [bacterium]
MKYSIQITTQFKKDYKQAVKRGCDIPKLKKVISMLADGEKLPQKYSDHALKGIFSGYRECHIEPDWLLIYKISEDVLVLSLYRTGSHSDLF